MTKLPVGTSRKGGLVYNYGWHQSKRKKCIKIVVYVVFEISYHILRFCNFNSHAWGGGLGARATSSSFLKYF